MTAISENAIARYLRAHNLTDRALASDLGVSDELVRLWRLGRRPVSAHRAVELSKLTGISLHALRPDLWESAADEASA